MKRFVSIIITLAVLIGVWLAVAYYNNVWPFLHAQNPSPQSPVVPSPAPTDKPLEDTSHDNLIRVTSLKANDVIGNPLTVAGQARGTWYFEASFPVRLEDANGVMLAQAPAQAQGEWMTEEFVPFSVTLDFEMPTTETGKLILQKDNPSGLPEHDDSLIIPIRFK